MQQVQIEKGIHRLYGKCSFVKHQFDPFPKFAAPHTLYTYILGACFEERLDYDIHVKMFGE